jgi:proline dehydrogenase
VIKKIPEPDSNTTVGEIEKSQNIIKEVIDEVIATEQQFTRVTNTSSGDHGDDWRSLTDAVRQYLRNTASECRALETSVSGEINNVLRNTIRVLEAEATKLNNTVESIMKKHDISDQEVGYQYRDW